MQKAKPSPGGALQADAPLGGGGQQQAAVRQGLLRHRRHPLRMVQRLQAALADGVSGAPPADRPMCDLTCVHVRPDACMCSRHGHSDM